MLDAGLWVGNRGNIPALVRLLRAFLERGTSILVANGSLDQVKDIVRFLVTSKANDPHGCELVEAMFQFVPSYVFFSSNSHPITADARYNSQTELAAVHSRHLHPTDDAPYAEQDTEIHRIVHTRYHATYRFIKARSLRRRCLSTS